MSLKLVHDDSVNIEKLDVYNFRDIADCARRWADQLESGQQGEPLRVILAVQLPDGVALSMWGDAANGYEVLGILEAAKLHAHDANFIEE